MGFVGQILIKLETSFIRGFLQLLFDVFFGVTWANMLMATQWPLKLHLPFTDPCGMEVWKLTGAIYTMFPEENSSQAKPEVSCWSYYQLEDLAAERQVSDRYDELGQCVVRATTWASRWLINGWVEKEDFGAVSLRLMTSQFKDIVTHTQKQRTVNAYFAVYGFKILC